MNPSGLPNSVQLAVSAGREINNHGRMYKRGAAYPVDLKLEVADAYQEEARQSGKRPCLTNLAKRFRVDRKTVTKVEAELFAQGRVIPPEEIRANQDRPVGPGSQSLCQFELYIIMMLYWEDPKRHLRNYKDWLLLLTGNSVSKDTINRVLLYGFPYKGNMVKPNLVPLDKFKPENQVRAYEYLEFLFAVQPGKVIFVDEKHLKGEELFSQKVRKDPTTGVTPVVLTDSDFRNTHCITAFCSINRTKASPVWFRIFDGINDADNFYETTVRCMKDGFFHPYDVIVADRATIHKDIEELLWDTCRVLFIFLPSRTPEWNPKELNWQLLVKRLANMPITALESIRIKSGDRGSIVAHAAADILNKMSFDDVSKNYSHCYKFFPHWRVLRDKAIYINANSNNIYVYDK